MLHLIFALTLAAAALEPVRIQLGTEPSTLDASLCDDLYCLQLLVQTNRALMRTDATGKLVENLARSHTMAKDGRTYRFKLVADAKWSDGKPITAEEVVFGILHTLDPKVAAPDASILFTIKGAHAFYTGRGPREAVGVRVDKGDVVVELEHPDVGLLGALTMPFTGPRRDAKFEPGQPSSGRYFVKSWKREKELWLEPNPFFSEPGQLPLLFLSVHEEAAAQNLFEAGKLDIMSKYATTETAAYRARGLVQTFPLWNVAYIALNAAKPPLNDVDWRRAIIGAVRREEIAKLLPDDYEAGTGLLPSRLSDYVRVPSDFRASMDKVRALKDKPRVKLSYTRSAMTDILLQKVQRDVRAQLGVDLELDGTDWKTLFARSKTDPPQMYMMGMSAPFDAPMIHLAIFKRDETGAKDLKNIYANPEYDALVDLIDRAIEATARRKLIGDALRMIQDHDAIVLPLTEGKRSVVVAKSITGFRMSPAAQVPWHEVRRK